MAVLHDYTCNGCKNVVVDLWSDKACPHCGSTDLSIKYGYRSAGVSVGNIEPTRMIDHSTGVEVMVTTMSEARRLSDNYAKSVGAPPGSFVPYVRTEKEHRDWKSEQKHRIIAAQLSQKIKPSDF